MEPILEIAALKKYYGKEPNLTRALDGISFQVMPGEFLGIMGSSGSGKSTLLNCIATVIAPTGGAVALHDKCITTLHGKALADYRGKEIGYLFQNFELIDNLTGRENILLPLALHGVIIKKNGEKVPVNIGEDENDPVFCISDLLIHLAQEQMAKNAKDVVEGEALNLIVGGRPLAGEEKDAVKANVLKLLADKYGVEEEDFLSAELEIVPAGKARDCGLDRSMIAAYGQDDRVCAYTSFAAMLEMETPKRTSCCLLTDKEEIGSVGATGMQSHFFENTMAEILSLMGKQSELALRRCLANSSMLSSDVSAAFDPSYASVFEPKNSAYCGRGLVFNKYTGSGGKSGSNDANAEYVATLRKIMDDADVKYQTAELGRVNAGGGGTIAYIPAKYGMNVIDSGVAVLSMHSPWEVTSKADIYEAYKGYKAFLSA